MSTLEQLNALVIQLQQNKQNKITFYDQEPLASEGSDGDSRFVHIAGDGLFYYVKYNGHWYSRVFNEYVTTSEDEINQTITNITETSTSFSSQDISGALTVGGTSTFNGSVVFTPGINISGIEWDDIGGTASGDPLPIYLKGSVLDDSDHFNVEPAGGVGTTSVLLNLKAGSTGGIRFSSGICLDPAYEASGSNAWSQKHEFNYTGDYWGTIQLTGIYDRHLALKRGSNYGYVGLSSLGDINLEPTSFKNVLLGRKLTTLNTNATVLDASYVQIQLSNNNTDEWIGIDNGSEGDEVFVYLHTGSNANLKAAFDSATTGLNMRVKTVLNNMMVLQKLDASAHGCTVATYNGGIAAGSYILKSTGLRSSQFVSGFGGSGWEIGGWDSNNPTTSKIEADNLTLRGTLSVYELLIQQIRATNGTVLISSCGKIDSITTATVGSEVVVMEDPGGHGAAPFDINDIVMVQRVKVGGFQDPEAAASGQSEIIKRIVRRVQSVAGLNVTLSTASIDEPTDAGIFEVGDELVRIGNTGTAARQNLIKLTADENNSPYIDVKAGISSWALWANADNTKVRLGNLTGITHAQLGSLSGYGLFSDNVYLTGDIHATAGYIGGTAGWTISTNKLTSVENATVIGIVDADINDLGFEEPNCGFYADGEGRFSLRDRLTFGTDGVLKIKKDDNNYMKIAADALTFTANSKKVLAFNEHRGGGAAAGDVRLGENSGNAPNSSNLWWDYSTGDLTVSKGATPYFKLTANGASEPTLTLGDSTNATTPRLELKHDKLRFMLGTNEKIRMDSAGDLIATNKIVGAKIQSAASNPKVLVGEDINSSIDNQTDNIIIGNWTGQTVGGSGSGILVKHGTGDFSKIGVTGFNRNGFDYPVHLYSGLHWGLLWNGGQNGTEINSAGSLSVVFGGSTEKFPHEIRNIKIGYWLTNVLGYPTTVPTGRKIIFQMRKIASCEKGFYGSDLYVRPANMIMHNAYFSQSTSTSAYHSHSYNSPSGYVEEVMCLHNDTWNFGIGGFSHTSGHPSYTTSRAAIKTGLANETIYYYDIPSGTDDLTELKVLAFGMDNINGLKTRYVVAVDLFEVSG